MKQNKDGRIHCKHCPEEERKNWLYGKLGDAQVIVPSESPWGAPCRMVPKGDTDLRMVIDFRGINDLVSGQFLLMKTSVRR